MGSYGEYCGFGSTWSNEEAIHGRRSLREGIGFLASGVEGII
jgi:hypothetical protein